jgi:hypothetical protein
MKQELPLFVPSQVPLPGSISSVSPQRRAPLNNPAASPYGYANGGLGFNSYMHSPQSYGKHDGNLFKMGYVPTLTPGAPSRRGNYMGALAVAAAAATANHGTLLPTPDPTTVGSVISDEDVALQLMRLGDASNFSAHGRTSTSTADDALSGRADASSEGGEETDYEGSEGEERRDGTRRRSVGFYGHHHHGHHHHHEHQHGRKLSTTSNPTLSSGGGVTGFQHFQHHAPLPEDEEDLSSKPRCQRCRKSKKGCDRQRPCGRCRDAGIGPEGCVSEEEGNGRKGRYGRHMGVSVKKIEGRERGLAPAPTVTSLTGVGVKVEEGAFPYGGEGLPGMVAYGGYAGMAGTGTQQVLQRQSMGPPGLGMDGESRKRKR